MGDAELRAAIRDALQGLNPRVEAALRRELAGPIVLEEGERLQFQICPQFFGITLVQTEEEILPDEAILDVVADDLIEQAQDADLAPYDLIEQEVLPWFADRWQAIGGPEHVRPAFAFFHGGLREPRYDLEERRWRDVSEIWPEEDGT